MRTTFLSIILFMLNLFICLSQITEWELIDDIKYPGPIPNRYEMRYMAIDCADDNNCIAVGNMNLVWPWNRVTSDGGKTWFTTLTDSTKKFDYIRVIDVAYPDTNLCIIIGDSNYIWRSTDKCRTWEISNLNGFYFNTNLTDYNIRMVNSTFGIINTPTELFITKDGGINWIKLFINLSDSVKPLGIKDVAIFDDSTIKSLVYNSSFAFYIISTKDCGISWESYKPLYRKPSEIFFINKNEGWAANRKQISGGSPKYRDIILHTTDGGQKWEVQLDTLAEKKDGLLQIHFADNSNGVANGYFQNTWITKDGGKHWILDRASKVHTDFFMNVFMLSNHEILGVGSDGYIFKSKGNANKVDENFILSFDGMTVNPNPASDYIEISVPVGARHALPEKIRIYNVFGQEVNLTPTLSMLGEGENNPLNPPLLRGNLRIDVSLLTPGLYFVRVGEKVGRFVKI